MSTITLDIDGDPLVVDLHAPPGPPAPHTPPVLLIHGWGVSGRYWRDLVARLGDQYAFIVPDLPGVGRSLPVRRPRDMFAQLKVIEALLAHLGVARAHVIGHSMGGGIAMLLAARRPDLVERLVLTSISLFRSDAERMFFGAVTEVSGLFMLLRAPWMLDVPLLTRQSAARFFYRTPADDTLLRAAFRDYLTMDQATAVASARSASDPQIPQAARQIQAPTLLVVTREDRLMPPANVGYTAETIPDCQVHWIAQCGHLPMVEAADEYAALVSHFLN